MADPSLLDTNRAPSMNSDKEGHTQTAKPGADAQLLGLIFAVLLVDTDGIVAEANPSAEDMLGLSAKRMIGKAFSDILSIHDDRISEGLQNNDTRMIARGLELSTRRGDVRANITSSPIAKHPGWRVITISYAGQDRDPNDDQTPLRAPAVLAHEVKNPLSAIRGASQLLDRRLGEKDKSLTSMIAREADRIAELIDRMQQLGSSPEMDMGPCNLHEAIRGAMATVRAARSDNVQLTEEFDPSLPDIRANRGALEQVLINLISNACDASGDLAEPVVTVRTRYVSGMRFSAIDSGKRTHLPVEIKVCDHGPGIDSALKDHIFEPFVSGKSSGQGLGLALVRKLVKDMGGRIGHDRDREAQTTNFRVNLAVAKGTTASDEADSNTSGPSHAR
jgi:two-component system nitrogen regulation sensor histidine kinase GlnL